MHPARTAFVAFVGLGLLVSLSAEAIEPVVSTAPVDVAKTPSPTGPIPIPYPNVALNTAPCIEQVKAKANESGARLLEQKAALDREKPKLGAATYDAAVAALYMGAAANCCAAAGAAGTPQATAMQPLCTSLATTAAGVEATNAMVVARRGGLVTAMRGTRPGDAAVIVAPALTCTTASARASLLLADAAKRTSGTISTALTGAKSGVDASKAAIDACVDEMKKQAPTPGAPPPPAALGAACSGGIACQAGLVCTDGVCKRVGVVPNGACDANQLCGPGLECRDSKCRLPCACAAPCLPDGSGGCFKEVPATETYREGCAERAGVCVLPCFRDASGACKIEKTRATTRRESCSKTCP